MSSNNTFCPLPWVSASLRNNGDFRVCCQANVSDSKGVLKKSDGRSFNAKSDSFSDARNADLLKEVRKTMLQGEWHTSCVRCFNEEKSGLPSRRIYSQEYLGQHVDAKNAAKLTQADGSIDVNDFPIRDLDLRFGNLCNLKCRMCGPTDSNSWYSDQVKLFGPKFHDSHGEVTLRHVGGERYVTENSDYDWYESKEFWNHLESSVSTVEHLYIVGGEPLLIHGHFDFLERIVSAGHAGNVVLEYNSNLTILPERAKKSWPHFKRVRIGASIDGFGKVNEYIRSGSEFSKIEANLEWLDQAPGQFDVWLACTVSAYNIHHLPDFILWKIRKNFKKINSGKSKPFLTTHLLHKPSYLNIKVLPSEVKQGIKNLFFKKMDEIKLALDAANLENRDEMFNKAQELLLKHIHFMESEDRSADFVGLQEYVKKLDQVRSTRFSEIAPWYSKYE